MGVGVVTSVMFLLLLALPVIGGIVLIALSRKRGKGHPACGKCGYDVTGTLGTTNARCPECGSDFGVVGILPPDTRTRRGPLTIGILLIAFPATCIGASVLMTRASYVRASQAAQAAAAQQQALAQQAMIAAAPADPAIIATFRPRVANLTTSEAAARMSAITQELAQRQVDQTLTAEIAGQLRGEFEALSEHLNSRP